MWRPMPLLCAAWSLVAATSSAQLYFSRDDFGQLYRINTSTAATTFVEITGADGDTIGLTETNDPNILYGSTYTKLVRLNIAAGTHTFVGTISGAGAEGLAWDHNTNELYGYINFDFFKLDPLTAVHTATLTGPPAEVEGLAWRNGFIYGLGGTNANLYRYSIAANSWSLVGDTQLGSVDSTGLAWDPIKDVFYEKSINDRDLYQIDPITAHATLIGSTGFLEGGGLAFVSVPEPSTLSLCLVGCLLICVFRRGGARSLDCN